MSNVRKCVHDRSLEKDIQPPQMYEEHLLFTAKLLQHVKLVKNERTNLYE